LHDLLRIVALESRRNRCLVIGEDLGTVPEGFRPAMLQAGILSYKVLYFERTADGAFVPPEHYPAASLVTVSTHDLPTLRGWITGRDTK
ncbi:4-alpha-glucanotransferase, partial [Salmonella enterica]|uniref:4-alpha-glucanotransferase n=1 Tax=Salmonella enterica TaxID=28901 RepID=UPI003D26CFD3